MAITRQQVTQHPLLELTTGFMSFKTFAAAVELDVFTKLAGGREVTLPEFAQLVDLQERPTRLLLPALVSLKLLEKKGEFYRNSAVAEEFLVNDKPYFFGGFVQFYSHALYQGWEHLVGALRANTPVLAPPDGDTVFGSEDDFMIRYFWEAMHALAGFTGLALSEAYDFSAHQRVLDVGGGSGGIPIELCRRVPGLTGTVYELPHVCPIVEEKAAAAGLAGVVGAQAGDFTKDERLPSGYDAMILSQVLHVLDEENGRALLKKCYDALEPGGAVFVCELLLDADRSGPAPAALMGLNMLIAHHGGENYSDQEYRTWLAEAGFVDLEVVRFEAAGATGAVIGRKGTGHRVIGSEGTGGV
ncbi:methyltransferase [Lentzea sp. NPDC051838]|uniref:methyltransferase n=1 Tax=Lentzea sp. NPDC051838 TaxID=3154849 RepID=UPI00342076AA